MGNVARKRAETGTRAGNVAYSISEGSELFGARNPILSGVCSMNKSLRQWPVVCESTTAFHFRFGWVVAINIRETEQATRTGYWHSAGLLA